MGAVYRPDPPDKPNAKCIIILQAQAPCMRKQWRRRASKTRNCEEPNSMPLGIFNTCVSFRKICACAQAPCPVRCTQISASSSSAPPLRYLGSLLWSIVQAWVPENTGLARSCQEIQRQLGSTMCRHMASTGLARNCQEIQRQLGSK